MQHSPMHRAGRPVWVAATLAAVVLAAMWWQPWVDDAVVPAPGPAAALAVSDPAPASTPAPAPLQVAAPTPSLKFVGTVTVGGSSFATVRNATDSQLLQLRVGDRVDGLTVTAIEPDRVVLAGAAQPIVIEPDRTAAPPEAPVPVAQPPASQPQPPAYAEGQAPWDLVPPFQH